MVKHTQTIRRQKPTDCSSVFDHFWGLALKGLKAQTFVVIYSLTKFHLQDNYKETMF